MDAVTPRADVWFDQYAFAATGAPFGRTMPARLSDMVNVKDWGATANGLTDDTAAIQAAIDYCLSTTGGKAAGGKVVFPPGSYAVSSPGLQTGSNASAAPELQLIGSGGSGVSGNTAITANFVGYVISQGSRAYDNLSHIDNLVVTNNNTTVGTGAVKLTRAGSSAQACSFTGATMLDASQTNGCFIIDCNGAGSGPGWVACGNPWPLLEQSKIGFYLGNRSTVMSCRVIGGCWICFAAGGSAITIRGCSGETNSVGVRLGWSPLLTLPTNAAAASGTNLLSFASFPAGSSPGRGVTGTGIPVGTVIKYVDGNNVVLSQNVTGVASGATITFSQENPAIGCVVQGHQDEATDTSLDLYNCVGCEIIGNPFNPTTGRPTPQALSNMTWSAGTVTATTATAHNIPAGTQRLLLLGPTAPTWANGQAFIVVTSPGPSGTTFTFPGPSSAPAAYNPNDNSWGYPLHYGIRFRKVSNTVVRSQTAGANVCIASNDLIYATTANPSGEAVHSNNVMIGCPAQNGWALPAGPNRAAWRFIDCCSSLSVVQNSQYQANPIPYGFMTFADLPGQSGVNQPGPYVGQEYDIIDGRKDTSNTACAWGDTVIGGNALAAPAGRYLVRWNGTSWTRAG